MSASTSGGRDCSTRSRSAPTSTTLARLPANDLASSPLTARLRDLGAIRADVTGAGPVVYGLFAEAGDAADAAVAIGDRAETWVASPA